MSKKFKMKWYQILFPETCKKQRDLEKSLKKEFYEENPPHKKFNFDGFKKKSSFEKIEALFGIAASLMDAANNIRREVSDDGYEKYYCNKNNKKYYNNKSKNKKGGKKRNKQKI